MTRDQIVARIGELQAQLDRKRADPLQSYSGTLAISAPILRELTELQEKLRTLDAGRDLPPVGH